ncbi:hypothetical protein K469DRAFT_690436 [Zopfia rhizophila CBS 207.26]|uniref:Uncharacterized protein n=1 Tax=Zopfia rhizophila CBS 207.26 TaxID=1314779 RepID=A0A6A6DTL9_9PEZI|nr:hypothetical protein K469DRAFT_690436 [Zopfia rhizophila CBS 207.26]
MKHNDNVYFDATYNTCRTMAHPGFFKLQLDSKRPGFTTGLENLIDSSPSEPFGGLTHFKEGFPVLSPHFERTRSRCEFEGIQEGHEAVVKLLLERDDVAADSGARRGQTPLKQQICLIRIRAASTQRLLKHISRPRNIPIPACASIFEP